MGELGTWGCEGEGCGLWLPWLQDEAAAQPTTSFVETLEENEEVDDSGRRKEGDTTEMVELELEGDRERDVEEEEEEEGGLIKPIIKFDKFPPDLSWDQI